MHVRGVVFELVDGVCYVDVYGVADVGVTVNMGASCMVCCCCWLRYSAYADVASHGYGGVRIVDFRGAAVDAGDGGVVVGCGGAYVAVDVAVDVGYVDMFGAGCCVGFVLAVVDAG